MLKRIVFVILLTSLVACSSKKAKDDIYDKLTAQQIYQRAEKHIQEKKFRDAIQDLEALEAYYPYGEYTDKGQIALIQAYYKHDEYVAALAAADRFLQMHPRHPKADEVYYLKGLITYEQNLKFLMKHLSLDRSARDPSFAEEAVKIFETLITEFPQSPYATKAKERIKELKTQLANYEFQVAEYYFKRGAYVAAIHRGEHIMEHYKNTEIAPKTLQLMSDAYRAMKMTDLATETQNYLKQHYPNYGKPTKKKSFSILREKSKK